MLAGKLPVHLAGGLIACACDEHCELSIEKTAPTHKLTVHAYSRVDPCTEITFSKASWQKSNLLQQQTLSCSSC